MLPGMRKYPREHWQALGDLVGTARHQAGYSDTKRWAEAVGRSSRMLLGLERGEPVGPKTIEAIAETLGIANWSLFEVLDRGRVDDWGASTEAEVAEARKRYQDETGLEADEDGGGDPLRFVSDEDLLGEVARRLAARPLSRTERRMLEARASWDEPSETEVAAHIAVHDEAKELAGQVLAEAQGDAAEAVVALERLFVLERVEESVFAVALRELVARRDAERDEHGRRSLSVAPDEVRGAIAADEQESSIAGEQEESDTP